MTAFPDSMQSSIGNSHLRVLVIGCGSIGKRHIGNLIALEAGEILAFDSREDRRCEVKSQFGIQVVNSLDEAWKPNPNVAVITTPTSMHIPLAIEAAQHGCHLFIEKPLSDSVREIDRLLNVISERSLLTLIGCNMRFHPGLRNVKKLLNEGVIGRVCAARVEVGQYLPEWHPWEDYRQGYSARRDLGGGIILDAIHEIDYIQWMLGQVEAVACFAGKLSQLEIDTEDTASILLRFSCGAIGEVHMDYIQRFYTRKCDIIGDEGTICWDYSTGETRQYSASKRGWQIFSNPSGWESNQMYIDEMHHFLRCLAGEETAVNSVHDALQTLTIALAAKASNQNNQIIQIRNR
jgi:predicted dehydrogenase